MKIAIQLFGHLRTYRRCFSALKRHLLNKYDCDIFIHTWNTIDHSTQTWHKNHLKNASKKVEDNDIIDLYHPQQLRIEKQRTINLGTIIANKRPISIFGIQSMFYSMKSVNDLRRSYETEKNIQYDFVLFIRPDVLLLKDFNIEQFVKKYSQKELDSCIFHAGKQKTNNFDFEWIVGEDVLFFLKPKIGNTLFSDLESFYRYLKVFTTIPYGPEYFLIQEEERKGLKAVLLKYFWGTHFKVLRPFSWKDFCRQIINIKLRNKKIKISLFTLLQTLSLHIHLSFFSSKIDLLIGRDEKQ